MGTIISPSQNAFVKGKEVLDCSIIANECINIQIKGGYSGVICQVDIDHVNWAFLEDILLKTGFSRTWYNLMKVYISFVSYFVMINGAHKSFFHYCMGIHQGDPLSPFLFNIVMEVLSRLVKHAEGLDLQKGCMPGVSGPMITLIWYADDSLFLLQVDEAQIHNLCGILLMFESIFGHKVN